ncbi:MAG: hypothetical protein RIT24_765, partial [Planctomycetota bacterium]
METDNVITQPATTGGDPKLSDFLRMMVKEGASDLVLKTGGCPAIRQSGAIRFVGDQPLTR